MFGGKNRSRFAVRAGERRLPMLDQAGRLMTAGRLKAHRALKEFKKGEGRVERLSEKPWLGTGPRDWQDHAGGAVADVGDPRDFSVRPRVPESVWLISGRRAADAEDD